MKVLHLTLKKKWFDMIASGEKKEEYREFNNFWRARLCDGLSSYRSEYCLNGVGWQVEWKQFDVIKFANGGHFHKSLPQMTFEFKGIEISTGKPEWGAEPGKEYFVIKLGEIISPIELQNPERSVATDVDSSNEAG